MAEPPEYEVKIEHIRGLMRPYMPAVEAKKYVPHLKGTCWLVGFVALRPKSTAMVIAGRSVHLTTLFPGQA